jgi:tetratricopeptide (TPR) repeat protein
MTKLFCLTLWATLGLASALCAQTGRPETGSPHRAGTIWAALELGTAENDPEDDPAYGLYREGYAFVLEEKWDAALAHFTELIAKHPTSAYVDDARYWSAYALKNTDRTKALEAYETFLRTHRQSRYFPDAMADLAQLRLDLTWSTHLRTFMAVTAPDEEGNTYSIAVAPRVNGVERQVRFYTRQREQQRSVREVDASRLFTGSIADPHVRLKIQALTTIGRGNEDKESFDALSEIALDRNQPPVLRIAAVNALAGFRKHDALPVLEQIARGDTSEELQYTAIGLIGSLPRDKDRAVRVLADLYHSLPADQTTPRESALFAIADVGNDRAVEFLARVATTDENFDLRGDAVFYLGNIGSARARATLVEILRGK